MPTAASHDKLLPAEGPEGTPRDLGPSRYYRGMTALKTPAPPGQALGPMTMKQLYMLSTGDCATHQRRIDGQVRKLDPRRLRVLRARCEGQTLAQIGAAEGCSFGSVASLIKKSMEAVRKAIANEPRFNRIGHPGGRAQQKPAA